MADEPINEVEEWREVPGHPGYEASSFGRVRSIDRWVVTADGRQWLHKGSILSRGQRSKYINIRVGRYAVKGIHVVVCMTFHGPCPSKTHEVAHWNGNRRDNRPDNLRWTTRKENYADAIRHGTWSSGPRNGMSKLTEAKVRAIRESRANGMTLLAVGMRFGISHSHVKRIADREAWKHLA